MQPVFISHIHIITVVLCFMLFSAPCCCGAENTGAAAISGITLSAVILEGSHIIPDHVRDKTVSAYLGTKISYVELELIRNDLTLWLVDNGFINSGVVIPDQEVNDGRVRMQVIAGNVSNIAVSGTSSFSADYFRSRLGIATAVPFNLASLRDMLQQLHQDPQIRSLSADLSAGARAGESTLTVKVSENRPWSLQLLSSNDNPPATGSWRGEIGLSYRNIIGYGDLLSARLGGTEGGYDMSVSAATPVSAHDTTVEAFYRRSAYRVIDQLFTTLDIRSESETFGGKISHPLLKSVRREIRSSLSLEHRQSRNFLLGQGFSFSQNEDDGLSRLTVGRFSLEWLERSASAVMVASSTISCSADTAAFLSWNSRLLWMQRSGWHESKFLLRADLQIAGNALPPMEKFALGGMSSIRGFRKNILVRDNAVDASLEHVLPLLSDHQGRELLALSTFFDYGRGWDRSRSALNNSDQQLAGAGLGVKISWLGGTADIVYAFPVIKPDSQRIEDLQDRGFHVLVTWSL